MMRRRNKQKRTQIVELPQFARNRQIFQKIDQDLLGASSILRSQRRAALLRVNVLRSDLYCDFTELY